jgi:hypothetical protein
MLAFLLRVFAWQTGIVVDSLGNLLVSDFKNNVIPCGWHVSSRLARLLFSPRAFA